MRKAIIFIPEFKVISFSTLSSSSLPLVCVYVDSLFISAKAIQQQWYWRTAMREYMGTHICILLFGRVWVYARVLSLHIIVIVFSLACSLYFVVCVRVCVYVSILLNFLSSCQCSFQNYCFLTASSAVEFFFQLTLLLLLFILFNIVVKHSLHIVTFLCNSSSLAVEAFVFSLKNLFSFIFSHAQKV